jgi:retinol dehydrogenase 12
VAMVDMTGKTVIITGGNSGIGLETAVALAQAGATTIITARDAKRGRAAVETISTRAGSEKVSLSLFDLSSLASVRDGAADLLSRCPSIDVLVNNAGVVLSERQMTVDGFEATFAINHLGPFLLTNLLLGRLQASAPSRIVNVASTAQNMARGGIPFDDLQSTTGYKGMRVYSESKLANVLFTTELARRLAGSKVTANCLHPGTVATGYGRDGDASGLLSFGLKVIKPFILTAKKGAATSIYLASSPDVANVSGEYFIKCKAKPPSKRGQDSATAAKLWDVSAEMVGLTDVATTEP